ncbi:hypothetical protein C8R43DRAFT_1005790 [Mycena crocata]|nr:hypothetical protein C8R43DRAFT_1005790 [Mycena crocata]
MTPKHSLPRSSPSSEPPRKRRNITSSPSVSYPYIPSSASTPYPERPADSPSNPFGRTRTWNLLQKLPPPTSFSKHLPLRFQYLKRGVLRETLDGVYRVVQVPQSYTLVHLRSLMGFLFGGAYGQEGPDPEDEEAGPGHMFEVKKHVSVHSSSYKPGQIKHGSTWAYSSSVLDPFLYYPDWDEEESADPSAPDAGSQSEDEPDDERKWTAEEDLTVAHAWPEGGDVSRAIIYQHSPDLQIHITINTKPIQSRRGKGNLPHVFSACGLVYLDDPEPEDRLEEEEPTALLDPSNWNEPEDAFAKYYGQHTILPYAGYHAEASSSVPSLSFSSSSPLRPSSSLASASSASSPSLCTSNSSSGSLFVFGSSPGTFPKYTPAPRPAQRKRIRHLQRRIGTLTRAHAEDETRPGRFWKLKPKKKPKAMRETSEDREYRETSVEI